MKAFIEQPARRALSGEGIDRTDALRLASLDGQDLYDLLYWAHRVRLAHFGRQVRFCSIAAGKLGGCAEDCKWCAQSHRHASAAKIRPQRADAPTLIAAAEQAARQGAHALGVVNSGRRPAEADLRVLEQVAAAIGAAAEVQSCASLGELDEPTARRLAEMGVRRYHHNLETSRRFYPRMVTTHDYDCRLATLEAARKAGMSLCSGGLFGLGETWEDRVDLALTLRDQVRPEVVPLNFLHPIPGTPLERLAPLPPMECLHIVALFRLLLPATDLKVAGGRGVNLRDAQSWIFYAGATSCLVGNYLTTLGRDVETDTRMVSDLGYTLVREFSRPQADTPIAPEPVCPQPS